MLEGEPIEGEGGADMGCGEALPSVPTGKPRRGRLAAAQVVHDDAARDRGQKGLELGELGDELDALARIAVAVSGDQHLGRDLPEAVKHAADPEVRRGRRPHRAEREGGQHRRHRLGDVG